MGLLDILAILLVLFDIAIAALLAFILILHRWHRPPKASFVTGREGHALAVLSVFCLPALLGGLLFWTREFSVVATASLIICTGLIFCLTLTATLILFSYELNQRWGKIWIKALDLPYVLFVAFGIAPMLSASLVSVQQDHGLINRFGISLLTTAIAIRLAKAIIEVFFAPWISK